MTWCTSILSDILVLVRKDWLNSFSNSLQSYVLIWRKVRLFNYFHSPLSTAFKSVFLELKTFSVYDDAATEIDLPATLFLIRVQHRCTRYIGAGGERAVSRVNAQAQSEQMRVDDSCPREGPFKLKIDSVWDIWTTCSNPPPTQLYIHFAHGVPCVYNPSWFSVWTGWLVANVTQENHTVLDKGKFEKSVLKKWKYKHF